MTDRTCVPVGASTLDESREPVRLGDTLAEVMPGIRQRVRRSAPVGATLSIPLSSYNETTLGDLRDLLELVERLPDSDAVAVYVPLAPGECGSISVIAGCEARA